MKIAILGSAPSSLELAPYSDPSWVIWGCSPGVYATAARTEEWFEIHRWEPGVIGKPHTQKPWFSPEYVAWMAKHPKVWVIKATPDLPNCVELPVEQLMKKYGCYWFTSTIAWMLAMAIDRILENRAERLMRGEKYPDDFDVIGLWGVDMAANEEYGYQRAGCQRFIEIAANLHIKIEVPPESDLLMPAPQYGLCEHSPMHIKLLRRRGEITTRLQQAQHAYESAKQNVQFLTGALDDINYMLNTWVHEGPAYVADLRAMFGGSIGQPVAVEQIHTVDESNGPDATG